jgi:hypothetical protein
MKTIIMILALALAILVGISYFWPGPVSKAEYQPEPVFTTEDQLFVQRAYSTLRVAIAMDKDAEARSHNPEVRDLSQRDKLEQKELLVRLKNRRCDRSRFQTRNAESQEDVETTLRRCI